MDENIQNENVDSTNDTVDTDIVDEEVVVDTSSEEEVAKLKEQNKKLFERAKTAEGFVLKDGHWVKKEPKPEVKIVNQAQSDPTDELRLIARGLSDDDIDQAKVIAKGRGVSLPEALKDPLFTAYKVAKEESDRKDKAKLGGSHGSGQEEDKPLVDTDMKREDHLKVWKERMGK